jgi:hypothetical protein
MPVSWELLTGVLDWPTIVVSAAVALLTLAYGPRKLRAAIIWVAQLAMLFVLVLGTLVAGRLGYTVGGAIGQGYNVNDTGQLYYSIAGAAVGGIGGFVVGALVCALFFVLVEIRDNTRG